MGNLHSFKKDDVTGGEEDVWQMLPAPTKASQNVSNNGQVTEITAEVHAESEDGDCGSIEPGAETAVENISQSDAAGSDLSSHTSPISQTDPDPNISLFKTAVKKVIMSGIGAKLIRAVTKCDFKSMKKILEEHKDLDLDCTDETGQAAIHYAASKGHMDTLRLLVENDAQLDLPDKQKGKTALHHAVNRDQVKAVEYLVYAGASMMVYDREGKKPEEYSKSDKMEMTLSNLKAAKVP